MGVEMVPKQGDGSKGSPTQMALVRPLIRVALHVAVQIGASWAGVTTQLTLECLFDTCTQRRIVILITAKLTRLS